MSLLETSTSFHRNTTSPFLLIYATGVKISYKVAYELRRFAILRNTRLNTFSYSYFLYELSTFKIDVYAGEKRNIENKLLCSTFGKGIS